MGPTENGGNEENSVINLVYSFKNILFPSFQIVQNRSCLHAFPGHTPMPREMLKVKKTEDAAAP